MCADINCFKEIVRDLKRKILWQIQEIINLKFKLNKKNGRDIIDQHKSARGFNIYNDQYMLQQNEDPSSKSSNETEILAMDRRKRNILPNFV